MAPYQFVDDLIREYLLFRGFITSLKAFDNDTKTEKEKGLRSDKYLKILFLPGALACNAMRV
jgi:hypothetical protein